MTVMAADDQPACYDSGTGLQDHHASMRWCTCTATFQCIAQPVALSSQQQPEVTHTLAANFTRLSPHASDSTTKQLVTSDFSLAAAPQWFESTASEPHAML